MLQLPISSGLYGHALLAGSQINRQHYALTRFHSYRRGGPRIHRQVTDEAFVDADEDIYRMYPRQPWATTTTSDERSPGSD